MVSRLIRFTDTVDRQYPGLLSRYDEDKNLVVINRREFERLPTFWQTRLQFDDVPMTRVNDDETGYKPYTRPGHREPKNTRYDFINNV